MRVAMRKIQFFLTLFGLSIMSCAAICQTNQPPFTISIAAVNPVIKGGTEVLINISMTNNSDHDLDCASANVNGVNRSYQYDILDSNGISMERHNLHPENYPGSIIMCILKPGESKKADSRVSWLHDLSQPCQYTIQVMRYISSDEKDG